MRGKASKYAAFLIVLGTSFFWSPIASANGTWQATNGLVSGNTVQFDYRGGSATYATSVSDGSTVSITVNNTIANCIGTCNPIPDVWTVSINGQSYSGNTIEITTLTAQVSGQLTIVATGRDIGFWGGWYGPIITVSIASPTPTPEPSPTVETQTVPAVVETQTPVVETSTAPIVVESQTVSSETVTTVQESVTVIDTSTVTSNPAPEPVPVVPSVPPAVEPQPTPTPVQPAPQPEPAPQPVPVVEQSPAPVVEETPPPQEETPPPPEPVAEPAPAPEEEAPPVAETAPVPEEPPAEAPEPEPEPSPEPEIESVIDIAPEPPMVEPTVPQETIQVTDSTNLAALPPDTPVQLTNGVVVTAEVAIAVALLQDPAALVQELFTDPAAAFAALGSVGADLPPEVRETAEDVVVSAIIAGGIATQAAASAAATATYRRKP